MSAMSRVMRRGGWGNSRNGPFAVAGVVRGGSVDLEVLRDRAGSSGLVIVRKGQRGVDGIGKIVAGLRANGMTVRDVEARLAGIYGVEVSPA